MNLFFQRYFLELYLPTYDKFQTRHECVLDKIKLIFFRRRFQSTQRIRDKRSIPTYVDR